MRKLKLDELNRLSTDEFKDVINGHILTIKKQLKQQEINNKINGGILTVTTKMANKEEKTENKNDKWLTMLLYNNMYDPNFKISIG